MILCSDNVSWLLHQLDSKRICRSKTKKTKKYGDVTDLQSLIDVFRDWAAVSHVAAMADAWHPNPSLFMSVSQLISSHFENIGTYGTRLYALVCSIGITTELKVPFALFFFFSEFKNHLE